MILVSLRNPEELSAGLIAVQRRLNSLGGPASQAER